MKSCGIIVEYNPFTMDIAIMWKWHENNRSRGRHCCNEREFCKEANRLSSINGIANEALQNGVDLVVELPVEWAVQSADYFAKGAVKSCKHWTVTVCVWNRRRDFV